MNGFWNGWLLSSLEGLKDYLLFAGIAFLLFYVFFKRFFQRRKMQKKFPSVADHRRDVLHSLASLIVFGFFGALVFIAYIHKTFIYFDISEYGMVYFVLSIPLVLLVHDTYFYWTHRLMHLPGMFRLFHKTHHKSYNPSPWSAYAFDLPEAVVEAGIIPVIAFIMPIHLHVFLGFFVFQIAYNVYGHLGYELYPKGFHKTWIGRWINTSVAHNMHHKYSKGNYGLYFLIWDRAMNTLDTRYDAQFEAVTSTNLVTSRGYNEGKGKDTSLIKSDTQEV